MAIGRYWPPLAARRLGGGWLALFPHWLALDPDRPQQLAVHDDVGAEAGFVAAQLQQDLGAVGVAGALTGLVGGEDLGELVLEGRVLDPGAARKVGRGGEEVRQHGLALNLVARD